LPQVMVIRMLIVRRFHSFKFPFFFLLIHSKKLSYYGV
jgi:hypothetical protein